jgi:uncharacterized membrane protein
MRFRVPLLASALALGAVALLSAWAWVTIEGNTVPAGIGDDLEPVSKLRGFVVGPALFVALPVLLFMLIPRIEPRRGHLLASSKAYSAAWITVLVLGVIGHVGFVTRAVGTNVTFDALLPAALALGLVVLGNYMGKIRSNFFFGIRTPWTLSSELSWHKTHRLGGKLLVLAGLALLPFAFLIEDPALNAVIGAVAVTALAIVLVVYSYVIWKRDPSTSRTVTDE